MKLLFLKHGACLLLSWLLSTFLISNVAGGTITVTSVNDSGSGSLREAVAISGQGDTILFSAQTNVNTLYLSSGELNITHDLIIQGNGKGVTIISGSNTQRIFNAYNCSLKISGLKLTEGFSNSGGGAIVASGADLFIESCQIENNQSDIQAGGILQYGGTTQIINSNLQNNSVNGALNDFGGGGLANFGGSVNISFSTFTNNSVQAQGIGGAILNAENGELIIENSNLLQNTAHQSGGGIADISDATSSVILIASTISDNECTAMNSAGGGIVLGPGILTLTDCSLSGNSAGLVGGGIWVGSGNLTMNNTSIISNEVNGDGGGIYIDAGAVNIGSNSIINNNIAQASDSRGGGIFNNTSGELTISNSNISNNSCGQAGAGIADVSDGSSLIMFDQVAIENNQTTQNPSAAGGILLSGGRMQVNNSSVSFNSSASHGGAFWVDNGILTISATTINNNSCEQRGGAIYNRAGIINIVENCQIDQNTTTQPTSLGGAIFNDVQGQLTIRNATMNNNDCGQAGAAIADLSNNSFSTQLDQVSIENNVTTGDSSAAGGILLATGTMNLINSALINNESVAQGGAIWIGSGILSIDNSSLQNNLTGISGGGIYNREGQLSISNGSDISQNMAILPGSSGGGIYNGTEGKLTISETKISRNSSWQAGGGIADISDSTQTTNIDQSIIESNMATGENSAGGGILLFNGKMTLTNSSINSNGARVQGGGIWLDSSTVTIFNTSINSNFSGRSGGGIYNIDGKLDISGNSEINDNVLSDSASLGAGIMHSGNGKLSIVNSTLHRNIAQQAGAAIADISDSSYISTLQDVFINNNRSEGESAVAGGLLLSDGKMKIFNSELKNNYSIIEGGGIWMTRAGLEISGSVIDSNSTASRGGGIFIDSGYLKIINNTEVTYNRCLHAQGKGGGIFKNSGAFLFLERSTVARNESASGAGITIIGRNNFTDSIIQSGIFQNNATDSFGIGGGLLLYGDGISILKDISLSKNQATYRGAGLWSNQDTCRIEYSHIDSNLLIGEINGQGGVGIYIEDGYLGLEANTLFENEALGSSSVGGGVFNAGNSEISVFRSTVSGNTVQNAGAGIYCIGKATIVASTFTNNTSAGIGGGIQISAGDSTNNPTVELNSSIIAGNSAKTVGKDLYAEQAPISSSGYNLIGQVDNNHFSANSTDITGSPADPVSAMLLPLKFNGGNTLTHALDCPSPAINSGDTNIDIPDQRGLDVFGMQRDIGAYEYQDTCSSTQISDQNRSLEIKVFPNPVRSKGQLGIQINRNAATPYSVSVIHTSTGAVHLHKSFHQLPNTIGLPQLPAGHYTVQIITDGKRSQHSLIILN